MAAEGRFSPRNQYVARVLETGGFTLLLDLLTLTRLTIAGKCSTSICLLTACCLPRRGLPRIGRPADQQTGYFGSEHPPEPGQPLQAAARRPGGRECCRVTRRAPLIWPRPPAVGLLHRPPAGRRRRRPRDEMNETALAQLTCRKQLIIIPARVTF